MLTFLVQLCTVQLLQVKKLLIDIRETQDTCVVENVLMTIYQKSKKKVSKHEN